MVDIFILNWGYKPTYNWGGHHLVEHLGWGQQNTDLRSVAATSPMILPRGRGSGLLLGEAQQLPGSL